MQCSRWRHWLKFQCSVLTRYWVTWTSSHYVICVAEVQDSHESATASSSGCWSRVDCHRRGQRVARWWSPVIMSIGPSMSAKSSKLNFVLNSFTFTYFYSTLLLAHYYPTFLMMKAMAFFILFLFFVENLAAAAADRSGSSSLSAFHFWFSRDQTLRNSRRYEHRTMLQVSHGPTFRRSCLI